MVDRKSKLTFIRRTKDKSAMEIQTAIEDIYLNSILPIKTLTSDNGTEFANHKSISTNIGCDFYFARPYCYDARIPRTEFYDSLAEKFHWFTDLY